MLEQFFNTRKLNKHIEACKEKSACKIEVPKPGETIHLKTLKNQ